MPELAAPGALYLLLGFIPGAARLGGDHNPILLFLPFLTVFLLCGGGRPQARLVAGGIFYTLLVPIGMMADTVLKQAINSVSHNGERVGSNLVKLVCWAGAGAGDLEAGAGDLCACPPACGSCWAG